MRLKLKAFTLLELLVAMAITGIVVSITGLVFNIIGSQFTNYKRTSADIASLFLLNNRVRSDFFNSTSIVRKEEALVLSKGEQAIEYRFMNDHILRTAEERTDTFFTAAENVEYSFMNEQVDEGLIDELHFETIANEQRESFHFIKRYSSGDLLNKEYSGN